MTDPTRELCELLEGLVRDVWDMTEVATARAMLARLRSSGPDGIRVAPVEPTEEMLVAAAGGFPEHLRSEHPDPADPWHCQMAAATKVDQLAARQTYQAMLRAAGERDS